MQRKRDRLPLRRPPVGTDEYATHLSQQGVNDPPLEVETHHEAFETRLARDAMEAAAKRVGVRIKMRTDRDRGVLQVWVVERDLDFGYCQICGIHKSQHTK